MRIASLPHALGTFHVLLTAHGIHTARWVHINLTTESHKRASSYVCCLQAICLLYAPSWQVIVNPTQAVLCFGLQDPSSRS